MRTLKIYASLAALLLLFTISNFGQGLNDIKLMPLNNTEADSSLIEYFPLHKGNLWQFRYRDNEGQMGRIENMVSYGDTIMPDGLNYTKVYPAPYYGSGSIKYYRIDSLFKIQEYIDSFCSELYDPNNEMFDPRACDNCLPDTNISVFRLNEPDSAYWSTCFNIGNNLFWPSLRYMGEFETEIFNKVTKAKVFTQYYRYYEANSNSWNEEYGWSYILVKGIGIYSTGFRESSSAILQGAIINGVQYGTVVGITDSKENNPAGFALFQNYPNPFNPSTTINFEIYKPSGTSLIIYDALGNEINKLIDNEELLSGMHSTFWDGVKEDGSMAARHLFLPVNFKSTNIISFYDPS